VNASQHTQTPEFGGWAVLYQRYRPRYPSVVFDRLKDLVGEPRHRCIEIGAGSGQATRDLLKMFDTVVAVEPDGAMAALIPPDPGLDIKVEDAEAVTFAPACADAVVAATALHWMEQDKVVTRAARWLRKGGVFFAFAYGAAQYPEAGAKLHDVITTHTRAARVHMHERLSSWRPYENALAECGQYRQIERFELYVEHRWSPAELAGFVMSTSYGQAYARASGDASAHLETFAAAVAVASHGRDILVRFPIEGAFGRVAM
jgi:SAM-dependent methyltransferase